MAQAMQNKKKSHKLEEMDVLCHGLLRWPESSAWAIWLLGHVEIRQPWSFKLIFTWVGAARNHTLTHP